MSREGGHNDTDLKKGAVVVFCSWTEGRKEQSRTVPLKKDEWEFNNSASESTRLLQLEVTIAEAQFSTLLLYS